MSASGSTTLVSDDEADRGIAEPSRASRPVVLRHRVQYAALRGVIGALGKLGFRRASGLGARIGRLGYAPLKIRRAVVERQIAAAFPEWCIERVHEAARAAYDNLGRTTIEAAILSRCDRETVLEMFDEPPNWHLIERAIAAGRGLIVVAGHLGNWEMGGAYLPAWGLGLEWDAGQQEETPFCSCFPLHSERPP